MTMWTLALLFGGLLANGAGVQRGIVNGVKANTSSIAAGVPVSVTVSGINPCGGAFIDYGDGTALTYAITGLPTTQSHAYSKPGAYPIKARGMGNCDGDAATAITVTGPPPVPPPAPPAAPNEITGVGFTPKPGVVRQLVAINVVGHGACAFTVKFGDGNQQDANGPLPQRINHTYAVAKTYTVIVAPAAPCVGKFTQRFQVAAHGGERITGLAIDPMPADTGRLITIDVEGVGTCAYRIDYGDANHEDRTKPLPDRVHHVYNAPGSYVIGVEASGPCEGHTQRTLDVR
jgi:hypothetical protein